MLVGEPEPNRFLARSWLTFRSVSSPDMVQAMNSCLPGCPRPRALRRNPELAQSIGRDSADTTLAALAKLSLVLILFLMATSCLGAAEWPQFRGPTGLGYTDEKDLALTWGGKENTNVLWSASLRGQGHASPIVWGNLMKACFTTPARAPARRRACNRARRPCL